MLHALTINVLSLLPSFRVYVVICVGFTYFDGR